MTGGIAAMDRTVGGFFSGIGGLEKGLEDAGWNLTWVSDIKPAACAVLKHHWPHVPNIGDITTIDHDNEWSAISRVRLICGGFPCQDLSHGHTNGKRKGLDGPQSGLWRYFARGVEALEPEWVIVENVDTWRSWVPTVRADLSRLGYASLPLALSAGSFGARKAAETRKANADRLPIMGEWGMACLLGRTAR